MNGLLQLSGPHIHLFSCVPHPSHYIHQITNRALWQASSGHILRRRKFTNYTDTSGNDLCICAALCPALFFQVIRVGGKYMHRQTRSYQGDLIQWVQDISLIGLSSISHAQKVSVSSYHTVLLWNHFLSWGEKAPQGKNMHLIRQENLTRYQIITHIASSMKNIVHDNRLMQRENWYKRRRQVIIN